MAVKAGSHPQLHGCGNANKCIGPWVVLTGAMYQSLYLEPDTGVHAMQSAMQSSGISVSELEACLQCRLCTEPAMMQ